MTQFRHTIIIGLLISSVLISAGAHADEVVMTTGERFTTTKVWEENEKIRFSMNGLVVSVNKSDVAAISGSDSSPPTAGHMRSGNAEPPGNGSASRPNAPKKRPQPMQQPPERAPKTKAKTGIKGIGFSGIYWHMKPSDLPGLTKIGTEAAYGGIDQYWRPDESMTLGNVLLDGLVFGFWQNRLYSIMIWVEGKSGYEALQNVILDRYGEGRKSKTVENRYVWVEDNTTDRMLEFDEERNIGIFWMRSRDLDNLIKKAYPDA